MSELLMVLVLTCNMLVYVVVAGGAAYWFGRYDSKHNNNAYVQPNSSARSLYFYSLAWPLTLVLLISMRIWWEVTQLLRRYYLDGYNHNQEARR